MSDILNREIEELSPQQVASLLQQKKILLIDVREPDEFAAERIAGALLYPLSTFDAAALPADSPRRVVFHCGTGKRSAMAANTRAQLTAAPAAHLAGGILAWKEAGLHTLAIDPASGKMTTR